MDVKQSRRLVAALKKRKIEHETFFREFEGHGNFSYQNRMDYYRAVERFLAKHLAVPPQA